MSGSVAAFPVPPVVKQATVPLAKQAAFDRFTRDIGSWWPTGTHSLSQDPAAKVSMEPGIDGRLIEERPDGQRHVWGTITRWAPPEVMAFTWHVGREPDTAQLIELSFEEVDAGRTLVTLTHSGWERLGEAAEESRNSYDRGWETVFLKAYADTGAGN
jgi:uncharacterized protein YndB with AHSA1/START domain